MQDVEGLGPTCVYCPRGLTEEAYRGGIERHLERVSSAGGKAGAKAGGKAGSPSAWRVPSWQVNGEDFSGEREDVGARRRSKSNKGKNKGKSSGRKGGRGR